MRIDFVNREIMDALLDQTLPVKYARMDSSYIFSDRGFVAYVLQENEIFFSRKKCMFKPDVFKFATAKPNPANRLTQTLDVRVAKGEKLLTRLKAASWDTFVDMDLLEAFDYPNLYQAEPLGIITVTECYPGCQEEIVCGFVMPARIGLEHDGHYNDKGALQIGV